MQLATSMPLLRILVIDDNVTIHEDIRKILCPADGESELLEAESQLFGHPTPPPVSQTRFQIDFAGQGREGLAFVEKAVAGNEPYALAFVDMRMPPGWDGIETVRHLWACCPELQIILCTAYSDHSWEEIVRSLGHSDSFVILKKPFDNIEVLQLAHALTQKWRLARQARMRLAELDKMVGQQTAQLTAVNEELRAQIRRRERTEMELRGSQHRFEMAFNASAIPMAIMHAPSQTYLEVNESFIALVARERDEILGKSPIELGLLVRPQDCEAALELLRERGRVRDFACRILPRNGEPHDTLISLEAIVLGEEPCVLVAMLDVTEQRKLETQLRQSQKMDAIGQLAAGVAHDFNNLLTIIHGHASLQMARPNQDEQTAHSLTQVKMAADRAATLTRQLLAFSRKQVIQLQPLSLNDSLEKLEAMLKRLLGETIRLDCALAKNLPRVFADQNSIDQVIMNLAVNARDAMAQGGVLRISTSEVTLDSSDVRRHPDARPGRFVRLSVADNGCGMDTAVLARIFEPFFTTKAPGKGTGLGLSTAYGIIKQHDGWMEVESVPGLGTKFHVFLAVTDKSPERASETSFFTLEAGAARNHETVLVVEDEPVLREFITAILQQQGYIILQAGDGIEALQVAQETLAKIDLLLTDMVMPNGVSGWELANQLRKRRADLKVIFSSGYSEEVIGSEFDLERAWFLPKPYNPQQLARMVRRCLDPSPNSLYTAAAPSTRN